MLSINKCRYVENKIIREKSIFNTVGTRDPAHLPSLGASATHLIESHKYYKSSRQ